MRQEFFTKQLHKKSHTAAQLFLLDAFVVGGGVVS